jgi:hypothetical protein
MQKFMWVGLVLLLSACAERTATRGGPAEDVSSLQEPGCYTVDLFREVPIQEPRQQVPDEFEAFLGEWGNGVWNGKWCHDLLIHTVHADGTAEMLDMHAPSEEFRQPASIFKRRGQISKDGTLHFAHGIVKRRYQLRDGRLYGKAEGGAFGSAEIVLTRKGDVPIPTPRPIQLAQATLPSE